MISGNKEIALSNIHESMTSLLRSVYAGKHNINWESDSRLPLSEIIKNASLDISSTILKDFVEIDIPYVKGKLAKIPSDDVILIFNDFISKTLYTGALADKRVRALKSRYKMCINGLNSKWTSQAKAFKSPVKKKKKLTSKT